MIEEPKFNPDCFRPDGSYLEMILEGDGEEAAIVEGYINSDESSIVLTDPEPVPDTKCPNCHGRGYLEEGIGLVVRGCRNCKETGIPTATDDLKIVGAPRVHTVMDSPPKPRKRKKAKNAK